MTEIYVDGSADNVKKVAPSYTSVWVPGDPGIIKVCSAKTNNEAEYMALIEGMRTAEVMRFEGDVTIITDSQLVVNQMKYNWKCKQDNLQLLWYRALEIARQMDVIRFYYRWCRREVNPAGIEMEKYLKRKKLAG